jgi:hypothetical protein
VNEDEEEGKHHSLPRSPTWCVQTVGAGSSGSSARVAAHAPGGLKLSVRRRNSGEEIEFGGGNGREHGAAAAAPSSQHWPLGGMRRKRPWAEVDAPR